jgi:hypothetical protein
MALIWMEGFDDTDLQTIKDTYYWRIDSVINLTHLPTGGQRGGGAIQLDRNNNPLVVTVPGNATYIVGAALDVKASYASDAGLFAFIGDLSTTPNVSVTLETDKSIAVRRGAATGAIVAQSATGVVTTGWHYIESRITIGQSPNGIADVWVDGVNVISATGLDTQNSTDPLTVAIGLYGHGISLENTWDDWYVADTSGGLPDNAPLGPLTQIDAILPTGDGTTNDFTPTGAGTTNADRVKEVTTDDDTTYVESVLQGDVDLYTLENLPVITGGGQVVGVQLEAICFRGTSQDGMLKFATRPLSTTLTTDKIGIADGYNVWRHMYVDNPQTAAAWTSGEVDASQFGISLDNT